MSLSRTFCRSFRAKKSDLFSKCVCSTYLLMYRYLPINYYYYYFDLHAWTFVANILPVGWQRDNCFAVEVSRSRGSFSLSCQFNWDLFYSFVSNRTNLILTNSAGQDHCLVLLPYSQFMYLCFSDCIIVFFLWNRGGGERDRSRVADRWYIFVSTG